MSESSTEETSEIEVKEDGQPNEILPEWSPIVEYNLDFDEYSTGDTLLINDLKLDDSYSLFRNFMSEEVLELMVIERNMFANQCIHTNLHSVA